MLNSDNRLIASRPAWFSFPAVCFFQPLAQFNSQKSRQEKACGIGGALLLEKSADELHVLRIG
jgi:hypothetical protein